MPTTQRSSRLLLAIVVAIGLIAAACSSDDSVATSTDSTTTTVEEEATTTEAPAEEVTTTEAPAEEVTTTEAPAEETTTTEAVDGPTTSVRESGLTVTQQPAGDYAVHTVVSPEQAFANATHIIETDNALVVIDTQFLLPNAADFRAYADSLGKPIEAVFITHGHPDHFLGSEVFADLPIYTIAEVAEVIAANGDAEVAEKQGDFGPELIASTYVVPEVVEPGTVEIDDVEFVLETVMDAEAEYQLVIRVPDAGAIATGDIIYSGIHLILAGPADTWTEAINDLATDSADYPIVLPGHGNVTDPSVYDANIAWLATASELLGSAGSGAEFKQGLLDAYPDLAMEGAIDFVVPIYFPEG